MIKILRAGLALFFLGVLQFVVLACQQKPTRVLEESSNPYAMDTVLVDTRSAFQYASYHIEGSINLESASYLILKDTRAKTRKLDPDMAQIIERLARRGLSPNKKVILLSTKASDIENKKWNWLLKNLEINDVRLSSLEDFKKELVLKKLHDRFMTPSSAEPWTLHLSSEMQEELIYKKSDQCFVSWSDSKCK